MGRTARHRAACTVVRTIRYRDVPGVTASWSAAAHVEPDAEPDAPVVGHEIGADEVAQISAHAHSIGQRSRDSAAEVDDEVRGRVVKAEALKVGWDLRI